MLANTRSIANNMSVILRLSGKHLDPETVAHMTKLRVVNKFRRGEAMYPLTKPRGVKHKFSGLNVQITPDDSLNGRASVLAHKAMQVISKRRREIVRITKAPGVEIAVLDIGISKLDVVGQYERIPAPFLFQLGKLGIDLEISIYHVFAEDR
jgi:hypothetical protein